MLVPRENVVAAFPPSARAGNVALSPLDLGGAIRLGAAGIDCGKAVPRAKLPEAAFVLSGAADRRRFLKRAKCGLRELSNAVEKVLNDAFETYLRPPPSKDSVKRLTPHGLGWPLELAESLCAEYGWGWKEALSTPVATAWALVAAARQRAGGRHGGMDSVERWYQGEVKAGRAEPLAIDK